MRAGQVLARNYLVEFVCEYLYLASENLVSALATFDINPWEGLCLPLCNSAVCEVVCQLEEAKTAAVGMDTVATEYLI